MKPQRAQATGSGRRVTCLFLGLFLCSGNGWSARSWGADIPSNAEKCARIVRADVVAIDQCLVLNRFGTAVPNGMIYALRRDVVSSPDPVQKNLQPGAVTLRAGKRPR